MASNDASGNPSTSSSYYSHEFLVVGLNRTQEVGRMIDSRISRRNSVSKLKILAAETITPKVLLANS